MDNEYIVILLAYNSVILLMLGAYIPAALLAACLARHVDPQTFLVRLMGGRQEPIDRPPTPPASPVSTVSTISYSSEEDEETDLLNTAHVLPDSDSDSESDLTHTPHESDDEEASPAPEFRPAPSPHVS
jgi:hypothetical protein